MKDITVVNTTPWDSESLTEFLIPLCKGTPTETIEVTILRAQPGIKREDQALYSVEGIDFIALKGRNEGPSKVEVLIISPKRVAAHTDLLDRMAQADSLDTHEIAIPPNVLSGIAHAFEKLAYVCSGGGNVGGRWSFSKHFGNGHYRRCECTIKPLKNYSLIRGNTKTRTAPPVDISRLKRRGRHALKAAERYRGLMERELALAERLGKRVVKEEAKAWKAKGDGR